MTVRIDADREVFTFINTFHTGPDRQEALVASLRTFTETATRGMDGFVGVAIHASADGSRVVNYVQWRSAAHMAAMRADPRFAAHMAEVTALADRVEPVVFTVAWTAAAEAPQPT